GATAGMGDGRTAGTARGGAVRDRSGVDARARRLLAGMDRLRGGGVPAGDRVPRDPAHRRHRRVNAWLLVSLGATFFAVVLASWALLVAGSRPVARAAAEETE